MTVEPQLPGRAPVASATRPRDTGRATIEAEIAALERLRDNLGDAFDAAVKALLALNGKVITAGVGKSGHAAEKVASTLCSVGVPAVHLSASNSLHGDLGVTMPGDLALLFSKSGMTRELLAIIPHLRGRGVMLIAVVGDPGSPLALESDLVLEASVLSEGCPIEAAPMASVLSAQAVGDALAAAVTKERNLTVADFARLHPAGALGVRLTLTVGDLMRRGDDLPHVHEWASLKDAVIEITRTGYGAVCVRRRRRAAGRLHHRRGHPAHADRDRQPDRLGRDRRHDPLPACRGALAPARRGAAAARAAAQAVSDRTRSRGTAAVSASCGCTTSSARTCRHDRPRAYHRPGHGRRRPPRL